ncbi:PEP-CTERM sorting domain-containing protein [Roseateles sp. BYS78W]|uniref:PEP-CTERM sorting domain-containing protein n=1 Tax=Pelomonas candidula TaxID=3299025 RepID=A0ABW7HIT6_9BURK
MKLKTLALAAVLAVSAPAFATVTTDGTLGQAEYVLLVTNGSGSYAQDLGISTDGVTAMLNGGSTFSQSVAGTEWTKFLNFGGTNSQYAIIAAQPIGDGFNPGEINAWTTVNKNQALGTIQNSQSNDGTAFLASHFADIDHKAINSGNGQANNRLASAFGTLTYSDNGITSFNSFFNARNAVGTASQLVYLTPSSDTSDAPSLYSILSNSAGVKLTANFDGNTVTIGPAVAAVPEPSTYAMLVGGLLAVSFVARRRNAS